MNLYLVFDTKGSGRVVGVFESAELARKLVALDPCYYKLHACRLNAINGEALSWVASVAHRQEMERLVAAPQESAGDSVGE